MTNLPREHCVSCNRDAPRLTEIELQELLPDIPGWIVVEEDSIPRLRRSYPTRDFASALELTHKIGALAELEKHHPALLTEWGRVTVTWWTHKIRGLHRNDVIMAAKTDEAVAETAEGHA